MKLNELWECDQIAFLVLACIFTIGLFLVSINAQ